MSNPIHFKDEKAILKIGIMIDLLAKLLGENSYALSR
jgi:hypothetical protein